MEENTTGYVFEIFCSIQGEGIYVGERQVFLRTAGCSAACRWCDTAASKDRADDCIVRGTKPRTLRNPLTVVRAYEEIRKIAEENAPVRTLSITGGEPLEQPGFVAGVARAVKRDGFRVYLDTNGLHPGVVPSLGGTVDVVAMDIKLPSATGEDNWDRHRAFLRVISGVECFVKIVIEEESPAEEIESAVGLVAEVDSNIVLVFQPEAAALLKTKKEAGAKGRLVRKLEWAQGYALGHLRDVRVIPQCHRILSVR